MQFLFASDEGGLRSMGPPLQIRSSIHSEKDPCHPIQEELENRRKNMDLTEGYFAFDMKIFTEITGKGMPAVRLTELVLPASLPQSQWTGRQSLRLLCTGLLSSSRAESRRFLSVGEIFKAHCSAACASALQPEACSA